MVSIKICRILKSIVPYVAVFIVLGLMVDQVMKGYWLNQTLGSRLPTRSHEMLQETTLTVQCQTANTTTTSSTTKRPMVEDKKLNRNVYIPSKTLNANNKNNVTRKLYIASSIKSLTFKDSLIRLERYNKSMQTPQEPTSVKGFYYGVHLFSAVAINSSDESPAWDTIVLQGWEHKSYVNYTFGCCIKYKSGKMLAMPTAKKVHWNYKERTLMPVKQYGCPNHVSPSEDLPELVTLAGSNSWEACHRMYNWYLPITFAYMHNKEIAVCAKLVYGKLAADDIMTWFEIHRLLGVNKVLLYTHKLNDKATKVLKYYRAMGMAEIIPFLLPQQTIPRKKAEVGTKSMQGWNDEQIPVYDCFAKLRGYKYMVVLDLDEYIIPQHNRTWMQLFDDLFTNVLNAAGFTFLVQLHLTTWNMTNPASKFNVGQYLNSSKPMSDRLKHVTIPSRLQLGGATTHGFWPQWNKGYRKYRASPNDAVIHHFRTCRKDWLKKTPTKCDDMERITDYSIWNILSEIETDLLQLRTALLGD